MATLRDRARPKLEQVKVLKREDLTPDLMLMWLEKPSGYSFKAGQYCTLGIDGIERAYSIVSGSAAGGRSTRIGLSRSGFLRSSRTKRTLSCR